MMNEVLDVLADVPPMLAAAWAAWLGVGLLLTVWYRRAKASLDDQQAAVRSTNRVKSEPRPAVRAATAPSLRSPAVRPAAVKGDPFADLAQIFDETPPAPHQRAPGEVANQND